MTLGSREDETLDVIVMRLVSKPRKLRGMKPVKTGVIKPIANQKPGKYCVILLGEAIAANTLWEILAKTLNQLADLDSGFLPRFEMLGGRTRRHVARNRDAIHPGRKDFARHTIEFRPGWWVGKNYSSADVRRILMAACDVVGLTFDSDMIVRF